MPLTPTSVAGVVLAAGRSTRMGSPKALLTFEGSTFLARLVQAFREGGCQPVMVVTGPEADPDARAIAQHARELGADTATNPDRDSDQVDSLRAAVRRLPSDLHGVLMAPVDSPGATPSLVAALIETAATGAPLVVPTFGGRRGHPILFGRTILPELMDGDLPEGARTLIRRYEKQLTELPVENRGVLLDVDTPADYRRLRGRPQ
ncbi:MAG: nucleotidyltransferase family protein [Gemmatimonadota bacterium]